MLQASNRISFCPRKDHTVKKAFLCHSSADKGYVQIVARYLGRAHVVFDEMSFKPGVDFRSAIIKGLSESSLMCFFASKRSIASTWCQFELAQADMLRIKNQIAGHLCLITDSETSVGDLPEWMRSAKALFQPRPSRACRDVQHALLELYPSELKRPFIGREHQVREMTSNLSDLEAPRKNIYLFTGLQGVGRRSLLVRCAGDLLGIQVQPIISLDVSDSLDDLYVRLLDDAGAVESRAGLAREIETYRTLPSHERVDRVVSFLCALFNENYLPCIVDTGALLNDVGEFNPEFSSMLEVIAGKEDAHIALVQHRTPLYRFLSYADHILHIRVPPLADAEITVLLRQLTTRQRIQLDSEETKVLSQFIDGYPPAAYFAIGFVYSYGVAALTADPSVLVDFKTRRFTRFIHDLELAPSDSDILKYMAAERPISLDALAVAVGVSTDVVADSIRRLIDMSLVTVYDDMYAVSAPIRNAVVRVFGFVERQTYEEIVRRIASSYWQGDDAAPSVDVVDATLHALARSGQHDFAPFQDIVRGSVVERLAVECYHRQEWQLSFEYARRGLDMEPGRDRLRQFMFKSLVKLERWTEAEAVLQSLRQKGSPMASYLRGFLCRNRGNYAEAIEAFGEAIDVGDRSYPVFRDLADSLYRVGRLQEAFRALRHVLDRDSENIFVLDLAVRILVDTNDFEQAATYLGHLQRFDIDGRFIHHRQAHFRAKQGMWDLALIDAEKAVQSGRAPFASFAEYANILIELSEFEKAQSVIDQLGLQFAQQRKDVQRGLRCKLLIRQGKWKAAQAVWDQLDQKNLPVHLQLLRRILISQSEDPTISLSTKQEVLLRATELDRELRQVTVNGSDFHLIGDEQEEDARE